MNKRIVIAQGDITTVQADVIVNAANESLLGGDGVDGAIHRAAGPGLLEECKMLNGCQVGQAKITRGYNLPAKWVIHTVGPMWFDGQRHEERDLYNCYRKSLDLAASVGATTIAFPAISCGAYGYPIIKAVKVVKKALSDFLYINNDLEKIYLILPDIKSANIYSLEFGHDL